MRTWTGLLLISLALSFLLRADSLFLGRGIDPDEGLALLQGRALCEGYLPYVKYFDHRQPLMYANFAAAQWLMGERVVACRVWTILCVAISAASVGAIALRVTMSRVAGITALATFILFSSATTGITATSELLMMPWTTSAVLLALIAGERTAAARWRLLIAAGLALGIGSQVKLLAIFELPAAMLAFAYHARPTFIKRSAMEFGALLLSAVIPTAAVSLVYALAGEWETFVYACFTFNRAYASAVKLQFGPLMAFLWATVQTYLPLVPLITHGLWTAWKAPRTARLCGTWLLVCVISACATKRFFPHYQLTLLPAFSLIAGIGFVGVRQLAPRSRHAVVVIIALSLITHAYTRSQRINALMAQQNESTTLQRRIELYSDPGDTIFLANNDPILYYVTRTEPATPMLFPTWIGHADWRDALELNWRQTLKDVLAKRPAVIVVRRERGGWEPRIIRKFVSMMQQQAYHQRTSTDAVMFFEPNRPSVVAKTAKVKSSKSARRKMDRSERSLTAYSDAP